MAELRVPDAGASMNQIARELAADFDDMPLDTIEQLVAGSFVELSKDARVKTYLPVLIKRVVREELRARSISAA